MMIEVRLSSVFFTKMGLRRLFLSLNKRDTDFFGRLPRSDRAFEQIRTLAERYPRTKFVSIVGNKCIPDLPDVRVPMILVYRKGEIKEQLIAWGADRERRIEGKYSSPSIQAT
jgi:hypothetical protein